MKSFEFKNWPEEEWHTCYAFMGYMEGALSSGYRLARRLAERDHILK